MIVLCIVVFWALVTLFDVDREAKKITAERKTYEKTKGGEKPMINWASLAIRAFVLAVVLIIALFLASEFLGPENNQKPKKQARVIEKYERSKLWIG